MASVVETFKSDPEFWKSLPESALELGFRSKLKISSRFLELLILNSDASVASRFRQLAKDQSGLIKADLAKFLAPLGAATSRRFLSSMKPKAVKTLLQKFISDVLTENPDQVSEDFSTFVAKASSDFNMTFELDNFTPLTGTKNVFFFRTVFELFKNSSERDETFLAKHVLGRCVEIIPELLKDFAKSAADSINSNTSSVANFCRLTIDAARNHDVAKLKKVVGNEKWQNFVRACLKHGLKLKLAFAIDSLAATCRAVYGEEDSVEVGQIYDLVCGHSSFVDAVLSSSNRSVDADLKSSVLNLILTLIRCKGALIRYLNLSSNKL